MFTTDTYGLPVDPANYAWAWTVAAPRNDADQDVKDEFENLVDLALLEE